MEYTLNVRAFLEIKRKDKANAHAVRLFPNLPFENVGRYWKDDNQWEIRIHHDCEYPDEKPALWETLTYFKRVLPNWLITIGPNDSSFELLINAIGENDDGTGLAGRGLDGNSFGGCLCSPRGGTILAGDSCFGGTNGY